MATSTYRRARLFDSARFKNRWEATLGERREELDFRIIGYVVMPEHFPMLIWPSGVCVTTRGFPLARE